MNETIIRINYIFVSLITGVSAYLPRCLAAIVRAIFVNCPWSTAVLGTDLCPSRVQPGSACHFCTSLAGF